MKKKILALALAMVMCLTALPVGAAAAVLTEKLPAISTSGAFTGTIAADGSLWMWGSNGNGELGNGGIGNATTQFGSAFQTVPLKVLDNVKALSCGSGHSAAIKSDGSLWTWGANQYGQAGRMEDSDGSFKEAENQMVPLKVMDDVVAVSCGGSFTAAIKSDGSLCMWGNNWSGTITRDGPGVIMQNVAAISCGGSHSAAIKTDGSLWTWGIGSSGQIGNNMDGYNNPFAGGLIVSTPVKVLDDVAAVSCGDEHTAAIKTDGSLWMWGSNTSGQLGNGGAGNDENKSGYKFQTVPVKVMDGVSAVSCGDDFTAVIKTDGSLWMWGVNDVGQLGNARVTNATDKNDGLIFQTTPVKVMDSVYSVSCGDYYTVAIKNDGSLWTWGLNSSGQLGNGGVGDYKDEFGNQCQTTPTPVSNLNVALSAKTSAQSITVNGKAVAFDVYSINGNNYFKLRDLAYTISGTEKQFDVGWDGAKNAISITSGKPYTTVGGEMASKGGGKLTGMPTASAIYLDGKAVTIAAYCIGGNNYFKLRDVGQTFNFGVDYDSTTNTVVINTAKGYAA